MARFVSESDESKCRMHKERKEKINFVFDINCFMILVACVYVCILFLLNSDSLRMRIKRVGEKKAHKRLKREREREQSTSFGHARKRAHPFIVLATDFFLINFV